MLIDLSKDEIESMLDAFDYIDDDPSNRSGHWDFKLYNKLDACLEEME